MEPPPGDPNSVYTAVLLTRPHGRAARAASPSPSAELHADVPSVFPELNSTHTPAHAGKFQTEFYVREVWTTCRIARVISLTNCNSLGEF